MSRIFVRRGGSETDGCDVVFEVGKNLQTGEKDFSKLHKNISTLESDLLLIASSIFAADRCTPRGEREDLTRGIELSVPVVNIGRLQPCAPAIEGILRTLSNDSWRINLLQHDGNQERKFDITASNGKTLLFSGGLDSLAAAFEIGRSEPGLQLVSHITHNQQTSNAQKELVKLLNKAGVVLPHHQCFVSSNGGMPSPGLDHDIENSQRTRSFLFLILGALKARRAGHQEILMLAENGQMAIHLPLTQARIGAFSTHTAHPDVLAKMEMFLQEVLLSTIRIVNPYVTRTKAEVIKLLWKQLPKAIPIASSCWKNTRLPSTATHCGSCIPCIIRRIAIESHGQDPTGYARDSFRENFSGLPPEDEARRNLSDLAEFVIRFERLSDVEIMHEWPELYSRNINAPSTINMYKRAAKQARKVMTRYSALVPLLQ